MPVDTLSLVGKIAIVTGSGRENGLGAGIAAALARNGAAVTINYVSDSSATRAEAVAKKIRSEGGKVAVIRAAVDREGAKALVEGTLKAFDADHIDILVNNAAGAQYGSTLGLTKEKIEELFSTNVFGAIYMVQTVVPHMPSGGRIINISSALAKTGDPMMSAYGATKAALDSLSYAWAAEFGKSRGITVNSVAPGPVATDSLPPDPQNNPMTEKGLAVMVEATRAANRLGTVEDIADIMLMLASEKARWITGQHIDASGGMTGQ